MRSIRVLFEDGNHIDTQINGSDQEIINYYENKYFQFGDNQQHPKDKLVKATKVLFPVFNVLYCHDHQNVYGEHSFFTEDEARKAFNKPPQYYQNSKLIILQGPNLEEERNQ